MTAKPQLVLDVAGVLVSNLSDLFWQELAINVGTTDEILKEQLNTIRKELWTGNMKEEQFWIWLSSRFRSMNKKLAYELLNRTMKPLPAIDYLEEWSRIADIHLLSNHCKEWLEPIILEIESFTKSITISNQVGYCKPMHQIYKIVEKHFEHKGLILFVDDQEKNLKPVHNLGWRTLLADDDNKWIDDVKPILLSNRF